MENKTTQGLADIFKKNRSQEILTPDFILEPIIKIWGEIALDPAGSKENIFAKKTIFENENGLFVDWIDKTFINPPFKNLKDWIEKLEKEINGIKRIAMLCPVRSHRKWWRDIARKCLIVFLPQMSFKGYKQKFPIPVCLLLNGYQSETLGILYEDSLILKNLETNKKNEK